MNATEINKRMEVYPSMVQSLNRSDPGLTISLFISAANITNHYRNTPMLGPYWTSTPTIPTIDQESRSQGEAREQ